MRLRTFFSRRGFDLRWWAMLAFLGCKSSLPSCAVPSCTTPAGLAAKDPPGSGAEPQPADPSKLPSLDAQPGDAAWIDDVRDGRWQDADRELEALPPARQSAPVVRLVRARVAIMRGDCARAVALLAGLERELTVVTEDIVRWRAEAALVAGPFEDAARYFERQGGGRGLAKAAAAFERAGKPEEARAFADRALGAGGLGSEEVGLRALRARLAEGGGQAGIAAEDARWICVHAPLADQAAEAEQMLGRVAPSQPLTAKERLVRADRLSEAGKSDEALAELGRVTGGADAPSPTELAWSRAFVLYRSRAQYDKAAAEFDRLALRKGPRQAEALFYAARSRSRADHDDEALRGYASVIRRFPASSYADDAAYLSARLMLLHARWSEAVERYSSYLKSFPRGRQREVATYERAIVLLAGSQPKRARAELHRLAAAAEGAGDAARLRELEGLAAERSGDREGAAKLFAQILATQPLGWGALFARARLGELGKELPPVIPPSDEKAADPVPHTLPPAAELYHRLGLDDAAEGYLRAHERELSAPFKGKERQVLCAMYEEIGRATRRFRVAQDGVSAAVLTRAPSPATEWMWDCLFPRPYSQLVEPAEVREGLPRGLLYAVMRQESAFDPDAVSPVKAVGLLQLMPETARKIATESGVDFDDSRLGAVSINIDLGARYLAKMLKTFDGSVPLAVAAYNAGPRAVTRWVERMRGLDLDLWAALIPYEETRTYVTRVISNFARYAYRAGGEAEVPKIELRAPSSSKLEASAY